MTLVFSSRPISDWIAAIIFPSSSLAIPNSEVRKFQLFAALNLDFIWMARNRLVHEGLPPSPSKANLDFISYNYIKNCISHSLNIHVSAWKNSALPSIWLPPCEGSFKCNFDVVVRNSFTVAAIVITDDRGNIVMATSQKLFTLDALQGEALVALLGVRLAASAGLDRLVLEGDSLLVVLAINFSSLFLLGLLPIVFLTLV
ncbi:hypothetical protein SLA2020_377340 [Shorea laevis]